MAGSDVDSAASPARSGSSKAAASPFRNAKTRQGGLLASNKALKPFRAPSSAAGSPTKGTPPPAKRARMTPGYGGPSPFKSPTKNSGLSGSPSVELAGLLKRELVLTEALRIVESRQIEETQELIAKWEAAGRKAADLLWERVGPEGPPAKPAKQEQTGWKWEQSDDQLIEAGRERRRRLADPECDFEDADDEEDDLPSVQDFQREVEAIVKQNVKLHGTDYTVLLEDSGGVEPKWDVEEMLRIRGIDSKLFGGWTIDNEWGIDE